MRVKWNNRSSEPFGVQNGLINKTGLGQSPSLFNALERNGDGARACGYSVGMCELV